MISSYSHPESVTDATIYARLDAITTQEKVEPSIMFLFSNVRAGLPIMLKYEFMNRTTLDVLHENTIQREHFIFLIILALLSL